MRCALVTGVQTCALPISIASEESVDYLAAIERAGQQEQRERDMRIGEATAARTQQVLDNGSVKDMLLHLNSPGWLEANARAYFRIGLYGKIGRASCRERVCQYG